MWETEINIKTPEKKYGVNHIIGAENIYEMLNYADVPYDTHIIMRGHTGGFMTYSWELIHAKYFKQKLGTKISTESEVVGASNYIKFSIWLAM